MVYCYGLSWQSTFPATYISHQLYSSTIISTEKPAHTAVLFIKRKIVLSCSFSSNWYPLCVDGFSACFVEGESSSIVLSDPVSELFPSDRNPPSVFPFLKAQQCILTWKYRSCHCKSKCYRGWMMKRFPEVGFSAKLAAGAAFEISKQIQGRRTNVQLPF